MPFDKEVNVKEEKVGHTLTVAPSSCVRSLQMVSFTSLCRTHALLLLLLLS
jgi:hypothetical protein